MDPMVTIINNALLYNTNTTGNNTEWWFQIFYFLLPTTHKYAWDGWFEKETL